MPALSRKSKLITLVFVLTVIAAALASLVYWTTMDGETLQMAVMRGDARKVARHLALKPETARYKAFHNYTALHWTAMDGRVDIAKALIAKGADVNAVSKEKVTPLFFAAQNGHAPMVKLLLEHGADTSIRCAYSEDACLHGDNPLHVACRNKHKSVVELLVVATKNINARDGFERTPLHYATKAKAPEIVQLLLAHGADPDLKDKSGRPAGGWARSRDTLQSLQKYEGLVNDLWGAAYSGDTALAELLLKLGADPNARDSEGRTPIYSTAATYYDCGDEADRLRIAEMLLEHGAKLHIVDRHGVSPLVRAFVWEDKRLAALLKKHSAHSDDFFTAVASGDTQSVTGYIRANPALLDSRLTTDEWLPYSPLHIAVFGGSKEMVELLLEAGCDPNASQELTGTPLEAAAGCAELEVFKMLFSRVRDCDLQKALAAAAAHGNLETMEFLLSKGARADLVTEGALPLWHCFQWYSEGWEKAAELLITHGADVNAGSDDDSVLYSSLPDPEHVRFLLEHGADPNTRCGDGTVLDAAEHPETIRLLLSYGARPSDGKPTVPLKDRIKDFFSRAINIIPRP